MASSGISENEGLSELLKETLKELRNISSELGEQSKAIKAMSKTQCQPLSPSAEQPMDNRTTKSRPPISAPPPADQTGSLEDTHPPEERQFWGDIDERFFSENLPPDYLEFIKNELYYNQDESSHLEDEPRDTTTSEAGSVIPPPVLSADGIQFPSSTLDETLDISVAQLTRRLSTSSETDKIPRTVVTQSLQRPNTSSAMSNGLDVSDLHPSRNNSPLASATRLERGSRVSTSIQRSTKRPVISNDRTSWNWFKTLPFDLRIDLNFKSFQDFLFTWSNFRNCGCSLVIRDWIHQDCYFEYNICGLGCDGLYYEPSEISAFASGTDSGELCTCKDICYDSSHVSTTPIAESYPPRKKAQLRSQTDEGIKGQWRRIILLKDISYTYKSFEQLNFLTKINDPLGFISHIDFLTEFRLRHRILPFEIQYEEIIRQSRSPETTPQSGWLLHGLCKRLPKSDYRRDGATFQITFYEMVPERKVGRGIWKTGAFRNNEVRNWERVIDNVENDDLLLRRSCVTIIGAIGFCHKWSPENWTMLFLTPSSKNISTSIEADIYKDGGRAVDREFIVAFSGIIDRSTRVVVRHWDVLANYFEKLLSESDTLLEPGLHDLLLVDDSKYSKSKKYFWALNILKEIESDIAAVISQLEGFMDFSDNSLLKRHFPLPEGKMSTEREKIVKKNLGALKEDLIRLQSRFSDQRELTKDLRDGLFNASAVMESRASTRLGENVRLLTFVSIFFLPLSFTMSIWGINDSALAHVNIMIGVAVVLGIITYFVVFNVDNIVFLSNQFIKKLKAGTIEHMKNNDDTIWKQRGDGLTEPALANEQNATPSSWRIPQYVWLLAWNWMSAIVAHTWDPMRKLFKRLAKKRVEQTEQNV